MYRINEQLDSFEKLKSTIIVREQWTIDNGLMTPTMKIKRSDVEKIYQDYYQQWYDAKEDILWEEVR
jgi:long-chain acyl-CoA synthetase